MGGPARADQDRADGHASDQPLGELTRRCWRHPRFGMISTFASPSTANAGITPLADDLGERRIGLHLAIDFERGARARDELQRLAHLHGGGRIGGAEIRMRDESDLQGDAEARDNVPAQATVMSAISSRWDRGAHGCRRGNRRLCFVIIRDMAEYSRTPGARPRMSLIWRSREAKRPSRPQNQRIRIPCGRTAIAPITVELVRTSVRAASGA